MADTDSPSAPDPRLAEMIQGIRRALPDVQRELLDAAIATTTTEELPAVLKRWATLAGDCFLDHLLSTPFEGLEFGNRSYDAGQRVESS